jgi:hypothetical protein
MILQGVRVESPSWAIAITRRHNITMTRPGMQRMEVGSFVRGIS